ncbi:MAG: hypothetical protein NTY90_04475 [Candidatus Micrarchaeota archaeon]|nr:hypothetical protein [Candidatus Micrarchaeota archaeon]
MYPPEQKSYFESTIPLILIIILAVFLAGKFGFLNLSAVPVVGSLFPAASIKVAIVGKASPELKAMLTLEEARTRGIVLADWNMKQESIYPGTLNNIDVIILQAYQGEGIYCDRTARQAITERVKAGGKLIVIGDACTRVHEDPAAVGWEVGIGLLGDVMPVTVGGVTKDKQLIQTYPSEGKLKIVSVDHPLFNGITNFYFSGAMTDVVPKSNAGVLAYLDVGSSQVTAPAKFAIIESTGLLTGKTMYFSFDPGTASRNMLYNTILYLKGAKG